MSGESTEFTHPKFRVWLRPDGDPRSYRCRRGYPEPGAGQRQGDGFSRTQARVRPRAGVLGWWCRHPACAGWRDSSRGPRRSPTSGHGLDARWWLRVQHRAQHPGKCAARERHRHVGNIAGSWRLLDRLASRAVPRIFRVPSVATPPRRRRRGRVRSDLSPPCRGRPPCRHRPSLASTR